MERWWRKLEAEASRFSPGAQGATIETGGGSIEVRQCNGKVKVSTGGGSVDLSDVGGPAEIETGGGSIQPHFGQGTRSRRDRRRRHRALRRAVGVGGNQRGRDHCEAGEYGSERSDSDLETGSGDITVYLASDVAINVRASVDMGSGHRITSDFSDIRIASEGDKWGPKTLTAEGSLNGGGPMLKVQNFNVAISASSGQDTSTRLYSVLDRYKATVVVFMTCNTLEECLGGMTMRRYIMIGITVVAIVAHRFACGTELVGRSAGATVGFLE